MAPVIAFNPNSLPEVSSNEVSKRHSKRSKEAIARRREKTKARGMIPDPTNPGGPYIHKSQLARRNKTIPNLPIHLTLPTLPTLPHATMHVTQSGSVLDDTTIQLHPAKGDGVKNSDLVQLDATFHLQAIAENGINSAVSILRDTSVHVQLVARNGASSSDLVHSDASIRLQLVAKCDR